MAASADGEDWRAAFASDLNVRATFASLDAARTVVEDSGDSDGNVAVPMVSSGLLLDSEQINQVVYPKEGEDEDFKMDEEEIVVKGDIKAGGGDVGPKPPPGFWVPPGPIGPSETPPSYGGVGGGYQHPWKVKDHPQDCGSASGAAVQVARSVMGLPASDVGPPDPLLSPSGRNWLSVEFSAAIVDNGNGTFGASNDSIYSLDLDRGSSLPDLSGLAVVGIWHNHTMVGYSTSEQAIGRYPSTFPDGSGDWANLASIAAARGIENPSLWILGPDGVTREFRLSDRAYIESLSDEQKRLGYGLEGRERSGSCGG